MPEVEGAVPAAALEEEDTVQVAAEALAQNENILSVLIEDLRQCGLVGEENAAKLLYLAFTSRVFPRPVSLVIKGPSAGGKSFLLGCVLQMLPDEAHMVRTAVSPTALVRTEESLKHRVLVVQEGVGFTGEKGEYFLRSLLSEGRLSYEVTGTAEEGFVARKIEKEGPTGLIFTTTKSSVHPENETRLLSISVDDSREQIRKVLYAAVEDRENINDHVDFARWHRLHKLVTSGEINVRMPFGTQLVDAINPNANRLKRDFVQVVTLIRAHALLHRTNRQTDEAGNIGATVHDYEVVRGLVEDILAAGVEASVPKEVRETVEAVIKLNGAGPQPPPDRPLDIRMEDIAVPAQAKDVAKDLGLDKGTTSRRISLAIELGYLQDMGDKAPGRPMKLFPAEELPIDRQVLPTAAQLSEALNEQRGADRAA